MSVNCITGTGIVQTNAQRNAIQSALLQYAGNHGINAGPLYMAIDKYSLPAFNLFALFENDRTEADGAWAAMNLPSRAFLQAGSHFIQLGAGDTVVHYEVWDPTRRVIV